MEAMLHNSPKTSAIRQRMEEVRCELDEDVQEIVEGARGMGKWRWYVRTYPWICLGAAVAIGYLIVPRRPRGVHPQTRTQAELANQSRLPATPPAPPTSGARDMLLTLVGNLVMRGIASYVEQQAGKLFAPQSANPPQDDQHEQPHS